MEGFFNSHITLYVNGVIVYLKYNNLQPQPKLHLRKVISILFLVIIFCSEIGYYFFYTLQQYQVKSQARKELLSNIDLSLLEKIDLEKNILSIEWEEEGKEFYLEGQLYDVKKTVIENSKTILYCINDKKEEQIVKKLGNASYPNKNKFTLKVSPIYWLTESIINISAPFKILNQSYLALSETAVPLVTEIILPPPRV